MIDMRTMAEEYARAYSDKTRIYFIEKYLSTFNADKGKKTQFMLFPRQKAFLRSIAEHGRSIAIKHRQAGITTVSSAWIAGQIALADPERPETVLCIGNKLDLANQLVTKIREFLMQVPRWYWGDEYYSADPKSEKNKKDIFVKNSKSELQLFNGCAVYARSSGENAARGISAVSILVFDEAAFIENGPAVYSSAVAATSSYGDRAKIIMVSTPNGKDELYYKTYRQALSHENNFNAVEFKWYQDLRYNKFLKWYKKDEKTGEVKWIVEDTLDETGAVKYDEERWRKLEREGWSPTSVWYQTMCKSFNNDSMKIAQELDVSFMGSSDNVVAPEFIEEQNRLNVREPLADFKDPLVDETWFWKKPIEGHRYICACLPEGEKVLTQRGLVNVEDVKSDDLLITKEGEFTKIKHRKYREVEDEEVVKIKLHNFLDTVQFTWNHPIWSSLNSKLRQKRVNRKYCGYEYKHSFKKNNADLLNKNAWIELPNVFKENTISEEELKEKWNKYSSSSDKTCPLTNKYFWWYCGMWLAEGYCRNKTNRITTVHHINEVSIQDKIIEKLSLIFDRKINKYNRLDCNACDVYFNHKGLYHFLKDTFGGFSYGKYISQWVKMIPDEFKLQLFYGYFQGDGNYYNDSMFCKSVSKNLINDFQDILLSLGIVSAVKMGSKEGDREFKKGVISHFRESYVIQIAKESTKTFMNYLNTSKYEYNGAKRHVYFSDDLSKIYVKVEKAEKYKYTGKVYNYETESDSHSYVCNHIAVGNCDPSRGTSADRTAIEIIDMDGQDENGMPIIEQVAEYVGKKLGDDIGAMVVQYAQLYNQAYVVVDCTGGQGDAAILTMLNLGYKNIYYEDSNQKTYTVQNSTKNYDGYTDKLPGFHFQGNRYPVLASFAGMVRNNEFKIRSARVINELDTWIFKEGTGRMDHMSGAHDDTLTSLAMGLFVMRYSLNRVEKTVSKDKAILNAYMVSNAMSYNRPRVQEGRPISPTSSRLPFYGKVGGTRSPSGIHGSCLWLFGGYLK